MTKLQLPIFFCGQENVSKMDENNAEANLIAGLSLEHDEKAEVKDLGKL